MLYLNYRMRFLALAVSLSLANGCSNREHPRPIFPARADLQQEAKPRLDPDALGSEAALDQFDIDTEAWGVRGWAAVGRICRWAKANGMVVECE